MDGIPIQHDFAKVCILAAAFAELAAPPPVRHHPEWPAAMITDLTRPHGSPHRAHILLDRHDALARSLRTEVESLQ
jgi:hypothetical protein